MGIILITVIIAVAATFFICATKCVALERENENLMNEVEVLKTDKAELAQNLSDAQSECLAVAEEASAKEKSLQGTILDQRDSLNAITAEIKALRGAMQEELADAVAEAEQLEDKRATPKKATKVTKATKAKKQ